MGGITDGPTVIHQLKSVFPQRIKIEDGRIKLHTENFVFRIYTKLTPIIFLLLAGLIFWQRMSGEHINCYAPPTHEDIRASAVNQYCFVTGTYTVTGYSADLQNMRKRLPYPGVGPHVPPSKVNGGGTEITHHLYFQWVPFILLIQAVILMLPQHLWKGILKDKLSRYCESILENDHPSVTNQAARRFSRNLKTHNSASRGFIYCEMISLLLALGCFAISDKLLNGNFFSLGSNWVQYLISAQPEHYHYHKTVNTTTSPLDLVFPKMSKCEFKMFGPSGGIVNYDILCVMTLNVIHDKVFIFQWFWLWFIVDLQLFNLVTRLILRSSGGLRWRWIMARVEPAFMDGENSDSPDIMDKDNLSEEEAKNYVVSLQYSDWFMLHAIANSVDAVKFTGFLQSLISLRKIQHPQLRHVTFAKGKRYEGLRKPPNNYGGNLIMSNGNEQSQKQSGSEVTTALISQFPGQVDDSNGHYQDHRKNNLYTNLPLQSRRDIMKHEGEVSSQDSFDGEDDVTSTTSNIIPGQLVHPPSVQAHNGTRIGAGVDPGGA